jgi:2-dehydropantoate 2-reductase
MKIRVVGAGAIGGWVAAKLVAAGETVRAVGRNGPLESLTLVERGRPSEVGFSRDDEVADLLILATKATALSAASKAAAPWIRRHTTILPMLNGVPWWFINGEPLASVDPDGAIGSALPINQVIGCVVHAACSRDSLGQVVVKHADRLIIGNPDGEASEQLANLNALFARAGLNPDPTSNIRRAIWYKLWGNATINPLSALTRATCDRILSNAECRQWMLEGMMELAAIGAAIGCPIEESGEDRMAVTAKLGAFKTSMLQDVEARRPLELEALLGAPREIARERGIATPALDRLYATTKLLGESLS